MRRRALLGLIPSLPIAVIGFGGCSETPVELGLVMRAPEGLLDHSSVDLAIFDATKGKCEDSGHATIPAGDLAQHFTLGNDNCPAGTKLCKTIQLEKDGSTKVFSVVAKDATGVIGEGCAVKKIDQSTLEVDIQIKRVLLAGCCNDGKLGVGEQCDTGVMAAQTCDGSPGGQCLGIDPDDVCDCDCKAKEILLSVDDASLPLRKNGPPGTKTHLALAFGPPVTAYPSAQRAFYVDSDADEATTGPDINMRILGGDLHPVPDQTSLALQLTLPVPCSYVVTKDGKGLQRDQADPAVARVGDNMALVYASDEGLTASYHIYLSPQTPEGCADDHPCKSDTECPLTQKCDGVRCKTSIQVDTPTADVPPGAEKPDVAEGPQGVALITWTRGGEVRGRFWKSDGSLSPSSDFLITAGAKNARVAGSSKGWRVVYEGLTPDDGDGIGMRSVNTAGDVSDAVRVNEQRDGAQDQPDIATLEDGTSVVVWHSGGDIFFQRFDADGHALGRDQDQTVNTAKAGDQQRPAVAASMGLGSFFAVAWESDDDSGVGNIAARFITADGSFGYNSVTGQNDEFTATHPSFGSGDRHLPAVAIGGQGFVVIGWQDDSTDEHHGVFVRRFPLPPFE